MDKNERLDVLKGEMSNGCEWDYSHKKWLIEQAEKVELLEHNLSLLIGAIYKYEPNDTYLYELAEDLDEEGKENTINE